MIKSICFFNDIQSCSLKPLSFTRPVADFRLGITTIRQKWEQALSINSTNYISDISLGVEHDKQLVLFLYGGLLPSARNIEYIKKIAPEEGLICCGELIAYLGSYDSFNEVRNSKKMGAFTELDFSTDIIFRLHQLVELNRFWIKEDYCRLNLDFDNTPINPTVNVIGDLKDKSGKPKLYIAHNATIDYVTINLKEGPVYIGENAEIMEGSNLRGPIAVCNNSKVNMGSRIYGGTTIGPWCKVGGEVNNTLFFGFSNKGHEGFLGDSVIGEWCNLGADTNNSNLKNDYSEVKLWDYNTERFLKTGRQFCGLFMGDYSRSSINTMFNTGTVVGIAANIATSGFPRNFVPSFTLSSNKITEVPLKSAIEIAERMMARRGRNLSEAEKENIAKIFDETSKYRSRL